MMTFSFEKMSHSPTLPFCMKIFRWIAETLIKRDFVVIFVNYLRLRALLGKSTKFVLEFCGLEPDGTLALVDMQPSVASTMIFYKFLHEPLAFLMNDFFVKNFSVVFIEET
jgi:hypothetical protein